MIKTLKKFYSVKELGPVAGLANGVCATASADRKKVFLFGIFTGLFIMLCLQMTYGHIVPISALLFVFAVLVNKRNVKKLHLYVLGISLPVITYFIFEYWISNGESFWFTRALVIAKNVGAGLSGRIYPLSQAANFTVIFVMGGFLCLSCTIFMGACAFNSLWKFMRKRSHLSNERELCRLFLSWSFVLVFLFLLFQKSVRLESERTLHWFFVYVWSMAGIFLVAVDVIYRRIFPDLFVRYRKIGLFALFLMQFLITLALSMGIQDYY